MKRMFFFILILMFPLIGFSQNVMTPELLWELGRVGAIGVTPDGKTLVYSVSYPNVETNTSSRKYFTMPVEGGNATEIASVDGLVPDAHVSPDGAYKLTHKSVKLDKVLGTDFYPDMEKSDVKIYESLHYRHWSTWSDGSYNHVFLHKIVDGNPDEGVDIMEGERFHSPTVPFGGSEDYVWSADGKSVVYVAKKLTGTDYVTSTNTDLYRYDIATAQTENLTPNRPGYDTHPLFSKNGDLAWLSMARNGYEADKNDIIMRVGEVDINLTSNWDGTVNSFFWAENSKKIYFTAPVDGTIQLFEVDNIGKSRKMPVVNQLTKGDFNVTGIVADLGKSLIVTRQDMNMATEIYSVSLKKGEFTKLTTVNDALYAGIEKGKVERRYMTTTDGKQMLVWVIFPPNFDASKKYPTLLYAQGGPQSALTQFYSFRWNFQLMAAGGYIIVAPNRRGMPGHGVEWNEQISKDWGGQVMDDYLTAIDEMAKEPFVDNERLGAIGASYGGYSVFQLAGVHENRFKTFISHAGVFNLESMYGTTEELFFVNWDFGGPYWDKENVAAQKTYAEFNPINLVNNWNTPMLLIHGGRDYRVPKSQSFEAFQVLQLKGIKSRLVFFPEENHWILTGQNAQVWHGEFFKWLKETL